MSKGEEEGRAPAAFPQSSPVVPSLCPRPPILERHLFTPTCAWWSARGARPTGLQLGDGDHTHEAQVKGLWPQVVSRAREGHAEDGYPLPLTHWGEQLQLAVHLHHGLPGSRAYVCPEPEGNRPCGGGGGCAPPLLKPQAAPEPLECGLREKASSLTVHHCWVVGY